MINNIWQCCYTNTVKKYGSIKETGWQVVAESDDIPGDVMKNCSLFQEINSSIDVSKIEADEKDIYEVFCDGKFVYLIKSFYGLKDSAGRPNMFSHAYIIPYDDYVIKDANFFLTISDDNFTSDEVVAEKKKNDTNDLSRENGYVLENILNELGLDDEAYSALIKAVFMQASNNSVFHPLYIQAPKDLNVIKKFIYCIYTGLPFYIRKKLKFASKEWNNAQNTNVIFSDKANGHKNYINPQTGDNNIFSDRENKRFERLNYVDFVAKNYKDESEINDYFSELEKTYLMISCGNSDEERLYRIAFYVNQSEDIKNLDTDEIKKLVEDIFAYSDTDNEKVQQTIADVLYILEQRGDGLYFDTEGSLITLLRSNVIKTLAENANTYFIHRFESLPAERAKKLLDKFSEEDAEFYRSYMEADDDIIELSEVISSESNHTEYEQYHDKHSEIINESEEYRRSERFEENRLCEDKHEPSPLSDSIEMISEQTKVFVNGLIRQYPEISHSDIFEQIKEVFSEIINDDITAERNQENDIFEGKIMSKSEDNMLVEEEAVMTTDNGQESSDDKECIKDKEKVKKENKKKKKEQKERKRINFFSRK